MKHQIGLDFARIIRAMLRQAPNIILVGEIRDKETAEIAVQASLTGHLVFSTLHTNDAPSAITRLVDIGVQPFLVASVGDRDHGPAAGARDLPQVQGAGHARREPNCKAAGITPEQASRRDVHAGPRLQPLPPHGLPRPQGHLRDDDDELQHPRDDVQPRADPGNPPEGSRQTGMRTLLEDGV